MASVHNQLKTLLLLGVLSAGLVALGGMLGTGPLYAFALLAIVLNVGAYFFSGRIVLRMHGAREVSPQEAPRLHALVDELAQRAGLPKPRVCLIDDPAPNAFATGRNPAHGVVAVTTGLLGLLSEREVRGVLAHELAHIRNRDILVSTIAAVLASALTYAAHAVSFAGLLGGSGDEEEGEGAGAAQGLLVALVAPIAATLIQLGISRAREYLADETGARIAGDADALADALEKLEQGVAPMPGLATPATASLFIVNPLAGSGLVRLFSTHPPIEDRVARLRRLALAQRVGVAA